MTAPKAYPLRLEGRLDTGLSRWLWLVKWLLAVPHFVVLALLWAAFAVLTVVAFFAVLVTGRYPAAIFSLNVGVLRWTWRVVYYCCGVLGTDRYPPFTLKDVPDYPARLDVTYPAHLSRGLVLVKWWLLALPHYVVVGLLVGGGGWLVTGSDPGPGVASNGLVGVLVLVAGVVLLVTGRYPQGLYDLVVGLQRWVFRVTAYATLMTDDYPPFRLDLGGADPGGSGPVGPGAEAGEPAGAEPGARPAATTATAARTHHGTWTGGRVVALVLGALLVLASVGLLGAGGAAVWADQTQRDASGYVNTASRQVTTSTSALLVSPLDITLDRPADALWLQRTLGTVRLQVDGGRSAALFVGLAPADDVQRYLAGAAVDRVRDVSGSGAVSYERRSGSGRPVRPETEAFWKASDTGTGPLQLTWKAESGRWSVVVMAADATPGVTAQVRVGATLPVLTGLSVALLAIGVVLLLAGLALVLGAVEVARRHPAAPEVPGPRAPGPEQDPGGRGGHQFQTPRDQVGS